jgi:hypothetical protein
MGATITGAVVSPDGHVADGSPNRSVAGVAGGGGTKVGRVER